MQYVDGIYGHKLKKLLPTITCHKNIWSSKENRVPKFRNSVQKYSPHWLPASTHLREISSSICHATITTQKKIIDIPHGIKKNEWVTIKTFLLTKRRKKIEKKNQV
mgnify:CR=1 FL=1